MIVNVRFEDWLKEQLKDPEFQAAYEELKPAYQVARLRIKKGWTQAQLAEKIGTKQSSIARLESGVSQPRLSFLRQIVEALDGHLEINILSNDETVIEKRPPNIRAVTYPRELDIRRVRFNATPQPPYGDFSISIGRSPTRSRQEKFS